jgi:hypothetical protein
VRSALGVWEVKNQQAAAQTDIVGLGNVHSTLRSAWSLSLLDRILSSPASIPW